MASHALLKALKTASGKPALGAWITVPSNHTLRAFAQASPGKISWLCVDCEHGLIDLRPGVADAVSTVAGSSPDPPSVIVRIPATAASDATNWQIKLALDAGARGIMVPMVGTAEQAQQIASSTRFPPVGRRGFGSPFTHGIWGMSAAEYLKSANESVVLMAQIETKEGVDNVEAIAAVDGIDVLFIGPYDLSLSLGYPPPNPDPHPEVEKVIARIRDAAHAKGKYCAYFCTSGKQAKKRATEGFDILNVIIDLPILLEGAERHFADAVGES